MVNMFEAKQRSTWLTLPFVEASTATPLQIRPAKEFECLLAKAKLSEYAASDQSIVGLLEGRLSPRKVIYLTVAILSSCSTRAV